MVNAAACVLAKSGACQSTGYGKVEAGDVPRLWVPRMETGGFRCVTPALTLCELDGKRRPTLVGAVILTRPDDWTKASKLQGLQKDMAVRDRGSATLVESRRGE